MKAVQIERFGRPSDVLQLVDVPEVGVPATGEVVIAVEASPINQYDLLLIKGDYGYRPRLPAIMGSEGVGRVVAVGSGVKDLKEGDRVLVPFLHPAWAERVKTDSVDEPDELSFRTRSAGVLRVSGPLPSRVLPAHPPRQRDRSLLCP